MPTRDSDLDTDTGTGLDASDRLTIAGKTYGSRLILGTGKYPTFPMTREALAAAEVDLVTVAVRRVGLEPGKESLLDYIDRDKYTLLPNTAGCFNAEDAIRAARLAREAGLSELVKLEVLSDPKTLLPDPIETLKACEVLLKEDFTVFAYTSDDPIMARYLAEAGVHAVMPLGSPIGSGNGILNPNNIRIILDECAKTNTPVIVDAGVGTASDAVIAMELGVEGVLMNSGVALADNPVLMAAAMKHAIRSGRQAFCAGRIPARLYGTASSPTTGTIAATATSPAATSIPGE